MSTELQELEDREEKVFSAELYLLRKIAKTSCDLVKAKDYPEFCEASGGLDLLTERHIGAVVEYKSWISNGQA